jgi:hypothetical protein
MAGSPAALTVARSALKLVQAHDKGAIPPPSEREPRRVAAHLGDYKIEGEYPPDRADSFVTINHNGALVLRAHVRPSWQGRRRTDHIELVDVRETGWFSGFLDLARASGGPPKRPAKRRARPKRAARAKPPARGRSKAPASAKRKPRRRRGRAR